MSSKVFIIRLALQQKETYTELFLYLLILDGSTISKQFFLEIRKVSSIIGSVILLEELALFMQDSSISSKLFTVTSFLNGLVPTTGRNWSTQRHRII
jgi:hypothetical protein